MRRPSPAMLVALLALFVALGGTAAAAIVVRSPDQLADRVVTTPKLAVAAVDDRAIASNAVDAGEVDDGSLGEREQRNPLLSARIDFTGSLVAGFGADASRTRRIRLGDGGFGYEVAFDRNIRTCRPVVTQDGGAAQGLPVSPRIMTAGRRFGTDDIMFVEAFDPRTGERAQAPVDGFSVLMQC